MRLTQDRLAGHLKGALAPIYLVAGDEPLQREESAGQIRTAARNQGYIDREIFVSERGFDWQSLLLAGASLSLFSSKRILEVRLPSGKLGAKGGETLIAYAQQPAADTLMLVICEEKPESGANWASVLDKAGVYLQVWPVEARDVPNWVTQRLTKRGFQPTVDAVALIAGRVEGNLLAAAQEVDKLVLLYPAGPLDAEAVAEAVSDSARFDAFKLVDAALAGDLPRTVRVLEGLQAEGEEPIMVMGALLRQLKELVSLAIELEAGQSTQQVLSRIWERRRPLVQVALRRRNARAWLRLLKRAQYADLVMKGRATGRVWDELLQLSTGLAGIKTAADRT